MTTTTLSKEFKKFVESGYARHRFTKSLYRELNLSSFGFIAHYDLDGFYAARFAGWPERVETFNQILESTARGPFEQAVQEYVKSLIERAAKAASEELEAKERAELARLKEKYERNCTVDTLERNMNPKDISKEISEKFGMSLPDWFLGVSENNKRFKVIVAKGFLQHPKLAAAVQILRTRLAAGETLSIEEQAIARP